MLKKFAIDTAIYGVGQALLRLVGLITLPIMTRYFSATEYGTLSILTLSGVFLSSLFQLGIPSSLGIVYFEETKNTREASVIWSNALFLLILGTAIAPIFWLFRGLIYEGAFHAQVSDHLVMILLATTVLQSCSSILMARLQFQRRSTIFVILSALVTILSAGSSIYLVVSQGLGVTGYLLGQLTGATFGLIAFGIASWDKTGVSIQFDFIRRAIKFGLPLVPGIFFLFGLQNAARLVIQRYSGTDQLGMFTVGFNLGSLFDVTIMAFTMAWYPFFQEELSKNRPESGALFSRIVVFYLMAMGTAWLLLAGMAKVIFAVLVGKTFQESVIFVAPAATSGFFTGLFSIVVVSLYKVRRVHWVTLAQAVAAVWSLLLNFFLIRHFGIAAATLSLPLSYIMMPLLVVILNRWMGWEVIEFRHRDNLILLMGMSVFGALLVACASALTPLQCTLVALVVVVIWLALCYLLLSTDERLFIQRQLKKFS